MFDLVAITVTVSIRKKVIEFKLSTNEIYYVSAN